MGGGDFNSSKQANSDVTRGGKVNYEKRRENCCVWRLEEVSEGERMMRLVRKRESLFIYI